MNDPGGKPPSRFDGSRLAPVIFDLRHGSPELASFLE
jgi:hypothetical protein